MKIRSNFVSNSSSSSFVIAYDPNFFGDLKDYFKDGYFGCETIVYDSEEENGFVEDFKKDYKKEAEEIEKFKIEGKKILYFSLDQEYYSIIELLKMINDFNGGNKLNIIYGTES